MSQQKDDLEHLWEEAVHEYLSKTKQISTAQKWKRPMTTQDDLNNLIMQHETDFEKFRSSHEKFWHVLSVTMGQLQNIGGIAQAALQLSPFAPAAVIVEAGLGLVRASAAVSETYDDLETLFRRVKDITDRVDEYLKGSIDEKLHRVVIQLLGSLLDVFGEGEAAIQRGRGKEMMRRALGRENKIQSALKRVDDLVQTEIALGTATIRSTTQRTEEKLDRERDRASLLRLLCPEAVADNDKFGRTIEVSRLPQSGAWLLEKPLYKQWHAMQFPVLWILGQPGTGKTYIASNIISKLHQNSEIVSAFYIRESMNSQHTLEVILKAMSYQITTLQTTYRERLVSLCSEERSHAISGMTWEDLFTELFVTPFSEKAARPIYVVIDGVDEATPSNQKLIMKLAKKLSDMRCKPSKYPTLQLLLLGRPELEYDISNAWSGEKRRPPMLRIRPSMSKPDVEIFIKTRVTKDVRLLKKLRPASSKKLRKHIVKTVSNSSDGMFMLAKLMLTEVEKMNKPELILETLAKPPKGLDDMFRRVVTRLDVIGGFDKKDLNELIMWVACAKRDLLLGELDLVLKLRDVRQNGIVGLEEELKTRFGSFFSVISAEVNKEKEESEDAASATGSEVTPDSSVSGESSGEEDSLDTYSDDEADLDSDGNDASEDGYEEEMPPSYFTATVKFAHASVGQHFRSAPLHRGIGMDINFARAHMALTCSRFLTDSLRDRNDRPWREPDLMNYSLDHFLDHFEEIDFEQLRASHSDIYISLSEAVVSLFSDHGAIHKWYHGLTDMRKFINQLFSKAVHTRLEDCLAYASTRHEDITTSLRLNSLEALLKPFALQVASAWLILESCDSLQAVLFLRGFLYLHESESGKQWTVFSNRPFELIAQAIPPEEIRAVASLGSIKKDMTFHRNLGSTFAKINTRQHLQSAIEEFDISIQLAEDPASAWEAYQNKAMILFALSMFEEAIRSASDALKYLPDSSWYEGNKRALLRLVSDANLHVGDRDAAIEVAKQAQRSCPDSPLEAFRLIFTAHRTGNYSESTDMLRPALESSDGAEFLGSILAVVTPQRHTVEYMLIACAEMGELDLARDAFQAVRTEAQGRGDFMTMAAADGALAQLYYEFYRDDDEAIHRWEGIVRSYPDTNAAFDASFALISWYFSKAQGANPMETTTWESKMEQLVDAVESMTPNPVMSSTPHEVAALLAKWYTSQGKMEKARARIRRFISDSIVKLTDQSSDNDYESYVNLGRALLCVEDRWNAAVSAEFTKPLRSSQESLEETWNTTSAPAFSSGGATNSSDNFFGRCDGGCDRAEAGFKSWNVCEICIDVAFCDECHPKVRAGTTKFRICDPKHPHVQTYPTMGLVTKGPEGYMVRLDDGREVTDDKWLAMINDKWVKT